MTLHALINAHNPILQREIRHYQRNTPTLIKYFDTFGIVFITGVLCCAISLLSVHQWNVISSIPISFLHVRLDMQSYLQLAVGIIFIGTLLRCILAGVKVTTPYCNTPQMESIQLTPISQHQFIIWLWATALYQVRGWMLALGLIRFTVILLMVFEFLFSTLNHDAVYRNNIFLPRIYLRNSYIPTEISIAILIAIILTIVEVWASTAIGIMAGLWVKRSAFASVSAFFIRAIPILVFSIFPTHHYYSYDFIELRWYEYTWFAFVDGGTTASLRLTTLFGRDPERTWLAFFAAFFMLFLYGIGAYLLARWRLRTTTISIKSLSVFSQKYTHSTKTETFILLIASSVISLLLIWFWFSHIHTARIDRHFEYNLTLINTFRFILLGLFSIATIRGIFAGLRSGYHKQLTHISAADNVLNVIGICTRLRGWVWGISLILMVAFVLRIADYQISNYISQIYDTHPINPYLRILGYVIIWQPSQIIFGLCISILLGFGVVLTSIFLGFGIGRLSPTLLSGLATAIILRGSVVIAGFVSPQINELGWLDNGVSIYWKQNPLMIFADYGTSALFQLAEPSWHTGHVEGLTHIGFAMLYFSITVIVWGIFILLGLYFNERKNHQLKKTMGFPHHAI